MEAFLVNVHGRAQNVKLQCSKKKAPHQELFFVDYMIMPLA